MAKQRKALGISTCCLVFLILDSASILHAESSSPVETKRPESRSLTHVELPFRLCKGNLVVVQATIGNVKNVNMVLDTGTNPSAISKRLAGQLKLRGNLESLQTLNGTIQVPSLTLPDLQLGTIHAGSLRVLVHDLGTMERNAGIPIGGILGLDILGTHPFTIDFDRSTVIFGSTMRLRNAVPLTTTKPFLTVRTTVHGKRLRLLVDSGTWDLLVFRNRLGVGPEDVPIDRTSSVSTTAGSTQLGWLHSNVSLGKSDLGVHKIAVTEAEADPDFDGLLGFAGMGFHKVSFDFENRLFLWE